jgi:hypothetical protein
MVRQEVLETPLHGDGRVALPALEGGPPTVGEGRSDALRVLLLGSHEQVTRRKSRFGAAVGRGTKPTFQIASLNCSPKRAGICSRE